jgi:antitoxin MazE
MRAQISKWGNSLAVRVPRQIAEEARIAEGTPVELEVENGRVVIRRVAPRYDLDELIAGMTPENLPDDSFDDGAQGAELL